MTNELKEPVIDLLCELIRRRSVTPDDAVCGDLQPGAQWLTGYTVRINQVADQGARYGFSVETRFVEAEPGTTVEITAVHPRAGTIRKTITL